MAGRREQVLEAAIDVLGTEGIRRLTYQSVDEAARVPAGTTSNHFRNRAALMNGVVAHMVALDRLEWQALADRLHPTSIDTLAEAMALFVHDAIGANRVRTTARYALFLEASARPELREPLARGRAAIVDWGARWIRHLGSPAPEEHCRLLVDYLDGVILHQVAFPEPEFDAVPGIGAVLTGLLGARPPLRTPSGRRRARRVPRPR